MTHSRTLLALAATAFAMANLPAQAGSNNPLADPPARLGDFTLAAGQTLRLNAHLTQPPATAAAAGRDAVPVQCKVTLSFENGGRGVGQSLIGLLRPGQNARLDLVGSAHVGAGQSLPVQPCIRVLPAVQNNALPAVQNNGLPAVQSCAVAVTLEVLDERGQVTAMVADPRLVTPDSAEQ